MCKQLRSWGCRDLEPLQRAWELPCGNEVEGQGDTGLKVASLLMWPLALVEPQPLSTLIIDHSDPGHMGSS